MGGHIHLSLRKYLFFEHLLCASSILDDGFRVYREQTFEKQKKICSSGLWILKVGAPVLYNKIKKWQMQRRGTSQLITEAATIQEKNERPHCI